MYIKFIIINKFIILLKNINNILKNFIFLKEYLTFFIYYFKKYLCKCYNFN